MVELDWNDVPGADSYDVQFFDADRREWVDLPSRADGYEIAFDGSQAIISNLPRNAVLYFWVRARNAQGVSSWSDFVLMWATEIQQWPDTPPALDHGPTTTAAPVRANTAATGLPTIVGIAQVGETLAVSTAEIADVDGLSDATPIYQWISNDGSADDDIAGATAATYTLRPADEGHTIKVRVAFTDDGGSSETLTSAATAAVEAAPVSALQGPTITLDLSESDPITVGTDFSITMSFGDLEFNSDTSDVDYWFRADVVDADECEGGGTGRDRYMKMVDQDPEIRSAAVPATCPAGEYTVQVSLSNADGTEAAKASLSVSIVAAAAETAVEVLGIPEEPPNVIVILVDDLGYNDVSFNGATEIQTTNIDRLAEEGIAFTNGYVPFPICTPSRAGLLTGRYPARYGLEGNITYAPFDNHMGLPLEETLFGEYLQTAGYRTGLVGKWQLGAAHRFSPLKRGFDYFYGFLGGAHDYYDIDATQPANQLVTPLIENTATASFTGYLTDVLTDKAIDFIGDGQDQPFFLYLAYNAPHGPLQAPADLIEKYQDVANGGRRTYLAMVDSLDQNIGRVMDALVSSGQRDDTIIFFLSDNGGIQSWADNGPLRGGKGDLWEGGIRVPFVASWPARWPQNRTYEPQVISLDIAATVLKMAGAAATDEARPLDGVNLDPYLRRETTGSPHLALFWRDLYDNKRSLIHDYAVRSDNMKLSVAEDRNTPMLVDLENDIGETTDLLASDRDAAVELARLWNAWNADNVAGTLFRGISYYQRKLQEFTDSRLRGVRIFGQQAPIPDIAIP